MKRAALVAVAVLCVFDALVIAADTGAKTLDDMTVKAFVAGDVDAIVALYAPDATVYPPGPPSVVKGSAAIRKVMADFLRSSRCGSSVRSIVRTKPLATCRSAGVSGFSWPFRRLEGTPSGWRLALLASPRRSAASGCTYRTTPR